MDEDRQPTKPNEESSPKSKLEKLKAKATIGEDRSKGIKDFALKLKHKLSPNKSDTQEATVASQSSQSAELQDTPKGVKANTTSISFTEEALHPPSSYKYLPHNERPPQFQGHRFDETDVPSTIMEDSEITVKPGNRSSLPSASSSSQVQSSNQFGVPPSVPHDVSDDRGSSKNWFQAQKGQRANPPSRAPISDSSERGPTESNVSADMSVGDNSIENAAWARAELLSGRSHESSKAKSIPKAVDILQSPGSVMPGIEAADENKGPSDQQTYSSKNSMQRRNTFHGHERCSPSIGKGKERTLLSPLHDAENLMQSSTGLPLLAPSIGRKRIIMVPEDSELPGTHGIELYLSKEEIFRLEEVSKMRLSAALAELAEIRAAKKNLLPDIHHAGHAKTSQHTGKCSLEELRKRETEIRNELGLDSLEIENPHLVAEMTCISCRKPFVGCETSEHSCHGENFSKSPPLQLCRRLKRTQSGSASEREDSPSKRSCSPAKHTL